MCKVELPWIPKTEVTMKPKAMIEVIPKAKKAPDTPLPAPASEAAHQPASKINSKKKPSDLGLKV